MVDKFLNYLKYELNRADLTISAYRNDLIQFQQWICPDHNETVDFISVTTSDIRTWLASLARQGDTPRTLRRKTIALRSFYKWLQKNGVISVSPLRDVPLPKLSKPLPDIVKAEEIEEVINSETKSFLYGEIIDSLVVEMLYSLGIRRAELVSLNDEDISFFKGELKVTGKRSKQRIIPIPEALLNKIKKWQEFRDVNMDLCGNRKPLFAIKGKRITASQVYRIVNKALQTSSAKKKSPHVLRHSFASEMLNGGAELDTVREFLGHASLSTTQIYTHISFNEIKKAYSAAHPRSAKPKK